MLKIQLRVKKRTMELARPDEIRAEMDLIQKVQDEYHISARPTTIKSSLQKPKLEPRPPREIKFQPDRCISTVKEFLATGTPSVNTAESRARTRQKRITKYDMGMVKTFTFSSSSESDDSISSVYTQPDLPSDSLDIRVIPDIGAPGCSFQPKPDAKPAPKIRKLRGQTETKEPSPVPEKDDTSPTVSSQTGPQDHAIVTGPPPGAPSQLEQDHIDGPLVEPPSKRPRGVFQTQTAPVQSRGRGRGLSAPKDAASEIGQPVDPQEPPQASNKIENRSSEISPSDQIQSTSSVSPQGSEMSSEGAPNTASSKNGPSTGCDASHEQRIRDLEAQNAILMEKLSEFSISTEARRSKTFFPQSSKTFRRTEICFGENPEGRTRWVMTVANVTLSEERRRLLVQGFASRDSLRPHPQFDSVSQVYLQTVGYYRDLIGRVKSVEAGNFGSYNLPSEPLRRAEFLQESLQNCFFAESVGLREGRRTTDMFFESPRFSEEEAKRINVARRDFFLQYPSTFG